MTFEFPKPLNVAAKDVVHRWCEGAKSDGLQFMTVAGLLIAVSESSFTEPAAVLHKAGLTPEVLRQKFNMAPPTPPLARFATDDLLAEVRRRMEGKA